MESRVSLKTNFDLSQSAKDYMNWVEQYKNVLKVRPLKTPLVDFKEGCENLVFFMDEQNQKKRIIEHFYLEEFACKDESPVIILNLHLLICLDGVRSTYNAPIKLTSAYRTYTHNKKVKGADRSCHLTGEAVDILLPVGLVDKNYLINTCNKYFPVTVITDYYIHCAMRHSQRSN